MFCKKGALRNFAKFTGKNLGQGLFFNKVAGLRPTTLFEKESLAQLFSCEFCEIFKNTFFYGTPRVATSIIIFNNMSGGNAPANISLKIHLLINLLTEAVIKTCLGKDQF